MSRFFMVHCVCASCITWSDNKIHINLSTLITTYLMYIVHVSTKYTA